MASTTLKVLDLAEKLGIDAKRAAEKAGDFEASGQRDNAYRALGVAEGLRDAMGRLFALAQGLSN